MWALLFLSLTAAATAECPRHCECKWRSGKESALCAHAGLTNVPPRLDPTTQLLDLSENRLLVLRDDAFSSAGLLNLQRLYLSSCYVRTIRQYAFKALVNLVELDLSSNRLDAIPSHAFESIPELRELRLNGNYITKIKDESFLSLIHLVRLSISSCKIHEIEPRAFIGLESSLEYLELDKNKLQSLHVAVLAPLRLLKGLELAFNPWDCTCELKPMRDWMVKQNVPSTIVPDCALPPRLMSLSWDRLDLEDFACQPEVNAIFPNSKVEEGDDVTLMCKVSAVPTPRVRWTKAGRIIANISFNSVSAGKMYLLRNEERTSFLTIKSTELQDIGVYTCSAENRAGKAEATLNLVVEKKNNSSGVGRRTFLIFITILAITFFIICLFGLFAYKRSKKRQVDQWNEQIVNSNRMDDKYQKIEANMKCNMEGPSIISTENCRTRGDYRNVPLYDTEDDNEGYLYRENQDRQNTSIKSTIDTRWQQMEYDPNLQNLLQQDLHIPRIDNYTSSTKLAPQRELRKVSTGVHSGPKNQYDENFRVNNNQPDLKIFKQHQHLENDNSVSENEKNYPDLIEMSALGNSYSHNAFKSDSYYFYTIPRRKDGESRSPLLNSRRNSSGGDSVALFERPYGKPKQQKSERRSNSFLDLSRNNNRLLRNPSLPTSPNKDPTIIPSATPLLDLSGLRQCTDRSFEDFDFRASQLEQFLEEYRSLRDQLSKMKETRENLQRTRAVECDKISSKVKGRPIIAVTETSSSVALADAASPLVLSSPEYKSSQERPEWLTTLLYNN